MTADVQLEIGSRVMALLMGAEVSEGTKAKRKASEYSQPVLPLQSTFRHLPVDLHP